jgi:hypothetical protein
MAIPYNLVDQAEPMEQAGLDHGIPLSSFPQNDEPRTTREADEVLVADARGGRTPSQMVEQKLLDLLGGGFQGFSRNATSMWGNIRRIPGK